MTAAATPFLAVAHPDWVTQVAPGLAALGLRDRIVASPRAARRLDRLLSGRLRTPPAAIAPPGPRDAVLAGDADAFRQRLRFIGAVSHGPTLRWIILRDEVAALTEALGASTLRQVVSLATLGGDNRALPLRDAGALRAVFEVRGSEHVSAWLRDRPAVARARARLLAGPDLAPSATMAERGDAAFMAALTPHLKSQANGGSA